MSILYVSTAQRMTQLPINDNQWHNVLQVTIPQLRAGQIVQVMSEQEVTSHSNYLTFVGSTVTCSAIGSITASMAQDISNQQHASVTRSGAAVVPADATNATVDLWMWGGSVWGSDPLTVEQAGYGRMSVLVSS